MIDTTYQSAEIVQVPAYCMAIAQFAKIADWAGAEQVADKLAAAWFGARASGLRGMSGRAIATTIDGTINWITVAIGRRDILATLRASRALSLEIGPILGRIAVA